MKEKKPLKANREIEQMLLNIHTYRLRMLPHIKKYRKIRQLHQTLGQKMIDFYHEHPEIQIQRSINEQTEKIRSFLYHLERFDLDDRLDSLYYFDSILYPNGFIYDMSSYFLDAHKVRSEQNIAFAKAMQESYLGMFEIIENNREEGRIKIRNLLNGKEIEIIDERLSFLPLPDKCFLWRIIEFEEICFQTGFTMMFDRHELKEWLKKHQNQDLDFFDVYFLYEKFIKGKNINRIHSYRSY